MEGSFPMYGSIGLILSALLLASAAAATLVARVLPRWAEWLAFVAALINLAVSPSILFGTDYTAFWSANGWATFIAQGSMVAWFVVASILLLRRKEASRQSSAGQQAGAGAGRSVEAARLGGS
jgi:hypothetical protein